MCPKLSRFNCMAKCVSVWSTNSSFYKMIVNPCEYSLYLWCKYESYILLFTWQNPIIKSQSNVVFSIFQQYFNSLRLIEFTSFFFGLVLFQVYYFILMCILYCVGYFFYHLQIFNYSMWKWYKCYYNKGMHNNTTKSWGFLKNLNLFVWSHHPCKKRTHLYLKITSS